MNEFLDYKGLNRGLKRKVTAAKKKQAQTITIPIEFASDISTAFDSLVREKYRQNTLQWVCMKEKGE